MSLNKNDRSQVEKQAENKGYHWNSEGTKMINGKGGSVIFSETEKSVKINGGHYNAPSGTKKSTKW
jgi:hypothetical protein